MKKELNIETWVKNENKHEHEKKNQRVGHKLGSIMIILIKWV